MGSYILAIDQGTTGTTASILDSQGVVRARADQDFRQIYPKPGWVEHDPADIWATVQYSVTQALRQAGVEARELVGIGITNQRETTLVWDRVSGKPIHNAIVWQDRRTSDICNALKKKKLEPTFRKKTGLVLDAYFSGTKIQWLLDHVERARKKAERGDLAFGTIDSYLLWNLTGGTQAHGAVHATDVTNASRTLLMDLQKLSWDSGLCKTLRVPMKLLPEIKSSSGIFGYTKNVGFLPDGIPVSGIAGDQQSALFGQACFDVGDAKCTFGTGSFLLLNTGSKIVHSRAGLITTVAWRVGNKTTYCLEGSTFICGAAVQWLRDGLGIIKESSEIESLALSVPSTDGVEFVPALTGLGAPYWRQEARGIITGITRGTTKAHLARATLEGMALQNAELLTAMEKDLKKKVKVLKVDGGASANNLLMQIQADVIDAQISRPETIETTSMGAAFLAGLGVGLWQDFGAIRRVWREQRRFVPEWHAKQRAERIKIWKASVARA